MVSEAGEVVGSYWPNSFYTRREVLLDTHDNGVGMKLTRPAFLKWPPHFLRMKLPLSLGILSVDNLAW